MAGISWRDTGRQIRFLGVVDGRAAILLMIAMYHISWWTFGIAVAGIVALVLLERKGYSIPNAFRRLRVLITGPVRSSDNGTRRGRSDR